MHIIPEVLWNEIKQIIPCKKSKIGRPEADTRMVLSGIFYVMVGGIQWRLLPDYYGPPTTVHGKFMKWTREGIFEKILNTSIEVAIRYFGLPKYFFCDTSSVKAPFAQFGGKNPTDRSKNGVKKGIVIDENRIV